MTTEIEVLETGLLIYKIEFMANEKGATIYNICHRNAGWAIQWHENGKQGESPDFRDGLIIYKYYETLEKMAKGEFERLNVTAIPQQ